MAQRQSSPPPGLEIPGRSGSFQSLSPRPELFAQESNSSIPLPPHERDEITNVPVTPGDHLGSYRTPIEPPARSPDSPSYFRSAAKYQTSAQMPELAVGSPTQGAEGATSGKEIIDRITSNMEKRRKSLSEYKDGYPDLALSGRIITATFRVPHVIEYGNGGNWKLNPRPGQSALFDSFAYLSSGQEQWDHTVVAWTGEIEKQEELSPPDTPPPATTTHIRGLNPLSAPIPVDGEHPPEVELEHDEIFVSCDSQRKLEDRLISDKSIRAVPVWLYDAKKNKALNGKGIILENQARWRRFAEAELYPLFHYKLHNNATDGIQERVEWADYFRMNEMFADKIMETYKPGDIVIVHDFYLLLLPSMLRQRRPDMYISFFLHTPFPSSEFTRCLPRRKEVLEGVLGANLIGFQTPSFARHFVSSCTRVLHCPSTNQTVEAFGTQVQVGVFPIGIDAEKVKSMAFSDAVTQNLQRFKKQREGKIIIVGRDRIDSLRGVDKKLAAFKCFLERYTEWRDKVILVQVTSPTAVNDRDGADSKVISRVNELVNDINGRYGSIGGAPVMHYSSYLSQAEYFALLRAADIGLITSIRDGMNTTSLEYVVCQEGNNGPLIISEFSGTASSLKDAIHINPWDEIKVAETLEKALRMTTEERRSRQENMYTQVTTKTVQNWTRSLIKTTIHTLGSRKNLFATPLLNRKELLQRYRDARKRLFLFDYDGTLTPIVRKPEMATPSQQVLNALVKLVADPINDVWIISGRDTEFLEKHLGHISELGFSAEHGSFMRHPGTTDWVNLAERIDMGWQDEVIDVFERYTERLRGAFYERKRCALTWHYREADEEEGPKTALKCKQELESTVAQKWNVEIMEGKANIEVRPIEINKGEIVKRLIQDYNSDMSNIEGSPTAPRAEGNFADSSPAQAQALTLSVPPLSQAAVANLPVELVLCMGDDKTDEDMFRSLDECSVPQAGKSAPLVEENNVFTVTIGASHKATEAKWHLLDPDEVVGTISLLAGTGGLFSSGHTDTVNLAVLSAIEGEIPEDQVIKA